MSFTHTRYVTSSFVGMAGAEQSGKAEQSYNPNDPYPKSKQTWRRCNIDYASGPSTKSLSHMNN